MIAAVIWCWMEPKRDSWDCEPETTGSIIRSVCIDCTGIGKKELLAGLIWMEIQHARTTWDKKGATCILLVTPTSKKFFRYKIRNTNSEYRNKSKKPNVNLRHLNLAYWDLFRASCFEFRILWNCNTCRRTHVLWRFFISNRAKLWLKVAPQPP